MTTQFTVAELQADAKKVYNAGPYLLVELADKYNVTTQGLSFYRSREADVQTAAMRALGNKAGASELQRKLYATIKGHINDLGE